MARDLTGRMGAILIMYVPRARIGMGMMGMVKDIRVAFIAGTGARTLRDQRERGLDIFLLDGVRATKSTATDRTWTSSRLLLLLLQVMMMGSRFGRSLRDRISR
jgi:hypothetical protein